MKLPSKKIFVTTIVCLIVIIAAVFFKQRDVGNLMGIVGYKPLTPTSGTTTPTFQSRDFYEKAIPLTPTTTVTEKLSRDFFLNYIDLQSRGKWDVNAQAALIDSLTSSYASSSPQGIKLSDIAIFSDLDKEKTRAFGNTVARTLASYSASLKTSPIDILTDTINKNSTTTLSARLTPMSRSYRLLAKDLAKIKAPASLAATYVDSINVYSYLAQSIDDMTAYFSDPIQGFLGLTTYQARYVDEVNLLKNMAEYFKTNGILFNTTETGYVWNSLSQ